MGWSQGTSYTISPLYTPRLCPICNGNPTRVSAAALTKLCQRYWGFSAACATCTPESLPEELTIIETQEEIMGRSIVVLKPCELCGETKNTKTNHGKQVCCNCEPVWRMVNNRPKTVFEALCEKHGETWLCDRLPERTKIVDRTVEQDIAPQLAAHAAIAGLREELNNAYDKIRDMQAEIDAAKHSACNLCADRDRTPTRDTAVLNIALKVIAGEITGITAADLSALR